ncbi:MAG: hypothetical protein CMH62_01145 [Nanoarchaeota archaeon]|nr:hypothetical protein [Nanoarchaeota archaeon]|tara:strand:- start:798 stop:1670 length:873 start_codon:yes stop_codon:yes gene_type:complete
MLKQLLCLNPWALTNNVKSGELIALEDHKDSLIINLDREANSKLEIDVSNLAQDLMWRYLVTSYRKGTTKVIIKFKDEKELTIIQDLVKDLLGMVIVEQNENTLVMTDMFINNNDIDASLKKIFKLLIHLSQTCHKAIKDQDHLSLKNIPYQDFNINKFTNLSIRLLNINGYEDRDKAYSIYKIISLLEEMGDEYRRLSQVYVRLGGKVNKKTLDCFEGINGLLEQFHCLYYDFDKKDLKKFYENAQNTLKLLKESYEKGNGVDSQILSSLDTILHLIKNLCEENMVVKL